MPFPGWTPLWLSMRLALLTVLVLLVIGTPVAWWLVHARTRAKHVVEAVVALPLVLPPTVLGFYLLLFLGPAGPAGAFWLRLTGETLTFSFAGLVVASVVYSAPFVIQPLQNAFESLGRGYLEAAATLGARPLNAFFSVAVPLSARGYLTAGVMGFAHTLGEFGVVLMVGGNIPGSTRVISIAIYDHVEAMQYGTAHRLSAILLSFAFAVLLLLYVVNRRWRHD